MEFTNHTQNSLFALKLMDDGNLKDSKECIFDKLHGDHISNFLNLPLENCITNFITQDLGF